MARAHGWTPGARSSGPLLSCRSWAAGSEAAVDGSLHWYPQGAPRERQRLANDTSSVQAAATDPSGTVLLTGGSDQTVVVSDLVGGAWKRREVLTGHHGNILQVAVSPARTHGFSTSDDGTVIEWDLTDRRGFGEVISPIPIPMPGDKSSSLIPIAAPVVAGTTPAWVVPTYRWPSPQAGGGEIFATFLDPGHAPPSPTSP
jgi:WD40 repeat protein